VTGWPQRGKREQRYRENSLALVVMLWGDTTLDLGRHQLSRPQAAQDGNGALTLRPLCESHERMRSHARAMAKNCARMTSLVPIRSREVVLSRVARCAKTRKRISPVGFAQEGALKLSAHRSERRPLRCAEPEFRLCKIRVLIYRSTHPVQAAG
jgi:hypothetical protein